MLFTNTIQCTKSPLAFPFFIPLPPPLIQCPFPALVPKLRTPLTHNPPRSSPDNLLNHPLTSHQTSQCLRPCLLRKIPRAVWIQPLVHNPFPCSFTLYRSKQRIWILRIG